MFVDIHNHILPAIDDGALSMPYALKMAQLAVEDGTDIMVATPHRAWQTRKVAPPSWVRGHVRTLQMALDNEGIALEVVPGVEIQVGPHVADDLVNGVLPTLGEAGAFALIELPFDRIPHDALDNLIKVLDAGIQIVLAHPERNAEIQKHLIFVEACADLGITFQLTTGSILGVFGPVPKQACEAILARAKDFQIVIASDSHDIYHRNPGMMATARDAAALIVGEEEAQKMVNERPRAMLRR